MSVSLAKADQIVDAALAKGRELNFEPLTVAVLDAGGHLVALKREDHSGILRPDVAIGKAWGALGMGFGSRELGERAVKVPHFMNALMAASGGRVVPVPGGVLILDGGNVIGSVGISGDTSDNDEVCCLAGIQAAGYVGQTGFRPPQG
ncbi:heme-binding protein [Aquabacter sp. CN5-332]|uniref:GlcG/HbpS family heme-binding protein n=1 Tax=Aquabacter sp. CN5-332 TaxID=3156608 RepID=UPI0032B51A79